MQTYTWMIVVHGLVAWLDAYGIGKRGMMRRKHSGVVLELT
jgi:hypothetical protein